VTWAEINQFFIDYEKVAVAFYTSVAFIGIVTAIAFRVYRMFQSHVEKKCEEAMAAQRNVFQAGYFDQQEDRYTKLVDNYVELAIKVARIEERLKIHK